MASSLTVSTPALSSTPGVTDGSSSAVGAIGEVITTSQVSAVGAAFTVAQWGNILSITLTPGDWLVHGVVNLAVLALMTDAQLAVSTISGNTTTDHVVGDNVLGIAIGSGNNSGTIVMRVNVTVSTTVYLKAKLTGAVGNALTGRLNGRRMR